MTVEDLRGLIVTRPGQTQDGRPFDSYEREQVKKGNWRLERISKDILGTPRDLEAYRAVRKTNFIVDWVNNAEDRQYCHEYWADLKIGKGSCGYRCPDCFLVLTHRTRANPSRHVLYENTETFINAARSWLLKPNQRRSLGLGIDCSDSLLYEGVTGYARRLAPLFADAKTNPFGRHLILVTKSANVHYLEALPTRNVVVTFSLNPQRIADIFEGRFPDGLRVTPLISQRLRASRDCERMGFETRWRLDPIIPVEGWQGIYRQFLEEASECRPRRITLGIYRQMGTGLKVFSKKWGLEPMAWQLPVELRKDGGLHYHLPTPMKISIYQQIDRMIRDAWPSPATPHLALCKETSEVRRASGISGRHCNCE